MDYLVYQAYGTRANLDECLYSLYTCEGRLLRDTTVLIYTDAVDYFQRKAPSSLRIDYRSLDATTIANWRGTHDFVHRVKIMMLLEVVGRLNVNDCLLYLDGDTKVRQPLRAVFSAISSGTVFMHADEGIIDEQPKHRILRKVTRYRRINADARRLIPVGQRMWNAGALGMRARDAKAIREVLELTDTFLPGLSTHVVEQLAFSVALSGRTGGNIATRENEVYHYWNFKEFRQVLANFFAVNTTEESIRTELYEIDPEILIQPKLAYQALPKPQKWLRKIRGKWTLAQYPTMPSKR